MLDFIWILDGMKVRLECIQGVIQVEPKWNIGGMSMKP
jgi:hypothetical protein